jgi:hypothetical protein
MQTPIVNETNVRRSVAEPDDFALDLVPRGPAHEAPREQPAPPAWEATTMAPRRSMA